MQEFYVFLALLIVSRSLVHTKSYPEHREKVKDTGKHGTNSAAVLCMLMYTIVYNSGVPNLLRTKRLNGITETETVRFLNGKNGNGRIQIAH